MSFDQLKHATKIHNEENRYCFNFVDEWSRKREMILFQLTLIPKLSDSFMNKEFTPYELNHEIMLYDETSEYLLSNAIESTANLLYSMAEIASNFANKLNSDIPSSFNKICKKIVKNELSEDLKRALSDIEWYGRVRELRTEWAHYSTIFIGMNDNQPLVVTKSFRRDNDKKFFTEKNICTVNEFLVWAQKAIEMLDNLGDYLLYSFVPKLLPTLDTIIKVPVKDENGFPLITKEKGFTIEEITVKDYLLKKDIIFNNN